MGGVSIFTRASGLLCVAVFAGCASAPKETFEVKSMDVARQALASVDLSNDVTAKLKGAEADRIAPQKSQDVTVAFEKMLLACQSALSGFDKRANRFGVSEVTIALVGAFAGGVVVPALTAAAPAANATWIAAMGGLSGVSNVAQQTLSKIGATTGHVHQLREQMISEWKQATNDYFNSQSSLETRLLAVQRGLSACTIYSTTIAAQ